MATASRSESWPKLGIIAGGGSLPRRLVEACRAMRRDVFVIAFDGQTDPRTVEGAAHAWMRLGAVGQILGRLKAEGVRELILAGPVTRPSLAELRPDWRGAAFLARVGAKALGDDGLLSAVVRELEGENFRVIGADDLLAELRTPRGPSGAILPTADAERDIARGVAVLKALSPVDVGQAVVVQQGVVLGIEAVEGTDALLARCEGLRGPGPGGVLVKIAKSGQERRVDLPTIGVSTIGAAKAAGLAGIALEAGGSMIIDREEVAAAADAAGLFVIGIDVSH